MSAPSDSPEVTSGVPRELAFAARAAVVLFGVVATAAYAGASFHRYFCNDDYALLYTSWQESLGRVPGRDYVVYSDHSITHGIAVLMRWFPGSLVPAYLFRLGMVGCLLAIAVLVYRITLRLFDRRSAWFTPPFFVLSVLVLNRAIDIRSDLITTVLWTSALALLVGPLSVADLPRLRSLALLVALGLVLGLMPVNRFKAAVGFPVFLALVLGRQWLSPGSSRAVPARVRRAIGEASLVGVVSLVPCAAYFRWLASARALPEFLSSNTALVGTVTGARDAVFLRKQTFGLLWEHDAWICVGIVAGVLTWALRIRSHTRAANLGVLGLLSLAGISVVMNPAYYAYNVVSLLPVLAPLGGHACAGVLHLVERTSKRSWGAPLLTLALVLGPLVARAEALYDVGFVPTNDHQIALHRYLTRHTPPDAAFFAMEGVGLFRPSPLHFWMPLLIHPRYEAGEFRYDLEMRERPPHLLLKSYRVPGWLVPRDRAFVAAHYVDLTRDFAVPGARLEARGELRVDLLVRGRYEVLASRPCSVDGHAFRAGEEAELEAGAHLVRGEAACELRLFVTPEARALLSVPGRTPYLVSPSYLAR